MRANLVLGVVDESGEKFRAFLGSADLLLNHLFGAICDESRALQSMTLNMRTRTSTRTAHCSQYSYTTYPYRIRLHVRIRLCTVLALYTDDNNQ